MPRSEGLSGSTQRNIRFFSVDGREQELLSSAPSMLQLHTVPGWRGLSSQKRTLQPKKKNEFWRQNSLRFELKLNYPPHRPKKKHTQKKPQTSSFSTVRLDPETAEAT